MTPNEVRKLGRSLTRERLGLPKNTEISYYLIAHTLAPIMGDINPGTIEHWLAGRRKCKGTAAELLRKLEHESRPG